MNAKQLTLDLPDRGSLGEESQDMYDADYRETDREWERCSWLWEVLSELPIDWVVPDYFDGIGSVFVSADGVYSAVGSDPHEFQDFIWHDEIELAGSDRGKDFNYITKTELAFIQREIDKREELPAERLSNLRNHLNKSCTRWQY